MVCASFVRYFGFGLRGWSERLRAHDSNDSETQMPITI